MQTAKKRAVQFKANGASARGSAFAKTNTKRSVLVGSTDAVQVARPRTTKVQLDTLSDSSSSSSSSDTESPAPLVLKNASKSRTNTPIKSKKKPKEKLNVVLQAHYDQEVDIYHARWRDLFAHIPKTATDANALNAKLDKIGARWNKDAFLDVLREVKHTLPRRHAHGTYDYAHTADKDHLHFLRYLASKITLAACRSGDDAQGNVTNNAYNYMVLDTPFIYTRQLKTDVENAKIIDYEPRDLRRLGPNIPFAHIHAGSTLIKVTHGDIVDVCLYLQAKDYKPVVVNFMDPETPGGKWLHEDDNHVEALLLRRTDLYRYLEYNEVQYPWTNPLRQLYAPTVHVLRDKEAHGYDFLAPNAARGPIAVLNTAALPPPKHNHRGNLEEEIIADLRLKLMSLLYSALVLGHDSLVMCVPGLDQIYNHADMAYLFNRMLRESWIFNKFHCIVVVVPPQEHLHHAYALYKYEFEKDDATRTLEETLPLELRVRRANFSVDFGQGDPTEDSHDIRDSLGAHACNMDNVTLNYPSDASSTASIPSAPAAPPASPAEYTPPRTIVHANGMTEVQRWWMYASLACMIWAIAYNVTI